jgi:PIN domain nuclease of toxin-antitoxin system
MESPRKIPPKIKKLVRFPRNITCLSSASLWEIAIKMNLGKLELSRSLEDLLADLDSTDIEVLQIEHEYLKELATLPQIHKDPFDRLLIATAKAEGMTIVTADENIHKYDVAWVW